MSEWPEGWFRGAPGAGQGAGEPGAGDPTQNLPAGARTAGAAGASPAGASPPGAGPAGARPRSAWPDQPPASSPGQGGAGRSAASRSGSPAGYRSSPASGGPGRPGSLGGGGARNWLRPRRILAVVAVIVALILVGTIAMYFDLNSKLHRKDVLVSYSGMPAQGSGTNWLIAGSDSRQGLSKADERKYATGFDVSGGRSDTVMILHMPSSGSPLLISVPRDSWVDIPGYGENKINAAYSFGGPKLLVKTVQNATGLRIDHYMEIGFGGFVSVVDDVGGVRMCIKYPLHDVASGLNIKKGCQTLGGGEALGYVRDRHEFADEDLQRVQDQRLLLKALLSKITSPGVLLNPFDSIPAADGAASTLTVDNGTNLLQLAAAAFAMRHPETTTVPISDPNYVTPTGQDAVLWNRSQALTLFNDLNAGKPVPRNLITGSRQAATTS